jgi:hypothetical protein
MSPVDKLSIALRLHTQKHSYNQMAILAKMQGPGNLILTTLKKKIGYGQYLGAKGGFTLSLCGYPVWPVRTWFGNQIGTRSDFWKFKTGPSSGLKTGTQSWF